MLSRAVELVFRDPYQVLRFFDYCNEEGIKIIAGDVDKNSISIPTIEIFKYRLRMGDIIRDLQPSILYHPIVYVEIVSVDYLTPRPKLLESDAVFSIRPEDTCLGAVIDRYEEITYTLRRPDMPSSLEIGGVGTYSWYDINSYTTFGFGGKTDIRNKNKIPLFVIIDHLKRLGVTL